MDYIEKRKFLIEKLKFCYKDDIINIALLRGLKIKKTEKKDEVILKFIELINEGTIEKIIESFKNANKPLGFLPLEVENILNVSSYERRKWTEEGHLKVAYFHNCDIGVKKVNVPIYEFTNILSFDKMQINNLRNRPRKRAKLSEDQKNEMNKNRKVTEIIKKLNQHPKELYPLARSIKRKFNIHYGETNSGKTYECLQELKKAENGVYLGPLRLLALEIYDQLNQDGIPCNLLTGEEENFIDSANHTSSTIEKLDIDKLYDFVVVDEAQMLLDKDRGYAWTRAILGAYSSNIHVCCSKNAVDLIVKIVEECGDDYILIEHKRSVPLVFDDSNFTFPESVKKADALIAFSRKSVLKISAALDEKGIKTSVIYGNLPPEVRRKQIQSFIKGETQVVVATDAIGMGLNLPIERVVFMENCKFDGQEVRNLIKDEILQIAGRAGRKGIYDIGYYNALTWKSDIRNKVLNDNLKEINHYHYLINENIFELILFADIRTILEKWNKYGYETDGIKKSDISNVLFLLDRLNYQGIILDDDIESKKMLFRMCSIPFDIKSEELLAIWESYSNEILNSIRDDTESLDFEYPDLDYLDLEDLEKLELSYKKINLYYSFSKSLGLEIDEEELKDDRLIIVESIHQYLLKSIRNEKRYCGRCNKELKWNFFHSFCDECYNEQRRRYHRNYYDDCEDHDEDYDEYEEEYEEDEEYF